MEVDLKIKWNKCLDFIRDNLGVNKTRTWFECARPVDFKNNTLTLEIPSSFYYEQYEGTFYNILASAIKKEFGESVRLDYNLRIIDKDEQSKVTIEGTRQSGQIKNKFVRSLQSQGNNLPGQKRDRQEFDPQLNEALTFENYCVSDCNILPVTTARHIAENPHKNILNPFFLFGDVGVGKTHLIQAIGIRIKEEQPRAKVFFVTSRQFQNLYATATINKTVPDFLNWFQQLDVLLIDDLQEISHKDGTVDQLFPIFNHLHQNGKVIVFTCDRAPQELDGISDRLIDRFKWGITEKLPKPDFELRKMILNFKARKNGLNLSEDIIDSIASRSTGSVRELEGVVMGILTRSIMLNQPITLQLAEAVMNNSIKSEHKKVINFDMIVETCAEFYKINPDAIFSKNRERNIADVRHIIMYLSQKHTPLTATAIGHKLNRKHSTVLHGIQSVENRLSFTKELSEEIRMIEAELRGE